MCPGYVGWRTYGKIVRKIQAAVRNLRSCEGLKRQTPGHEITELRFNPAAVGTDSQHTLHYGVPVAQLKVSAWQHRRQTSSEAHTHLHLPQVGSHCRVREVFIVMARERHSHEGSELDRTPEDVIPETDMHILKRSMIVAVVDRKLMRERAAMLADSVGHA